MAEQSGIQVVVRLRPMSQRELKGNTLPVVTASTDKKEVTVIKGTGARTLRNTYAFDNVFTSFSTQKEVFDSTLAPVISDVLGGYESTVFAYGQTGTGKTHTMEGDINSSENRGVIPRAAFDVFRRLADDSYVESKVTASFLEIYNEELGDLLCDVDLNDLTALQQKQKQLRLVEDPGTATKKGRGMYVMNLTEEPVECPEDVLKLMARASERRAVGETKMNKHSSRSHCVFTLRVESKRVLPDGNMMETVGKLHMVDLAGSECAKSAGGADVDPARERERKNINQSLLTLGRVITLLKAGGKAKGERIPYRDSKLTRLLQESLGGRCKTCVIATVSPSIMSVDESLSTLQYAQAAVGIKNMVQANSMVKVNVDGVQRPSTANPASNGACAQDWAELEIKMKYLEAQAEEAAAALARKHTEVQGLTERVELAEAKIVSEGKRADEAERALEAEKVAAAKAAAEAEAKRLELEAKLEDARREIAKRDTLLAARRETERKLTSEAKALLAALDAAVAQGADMHAKLTAIAHAEAAKRAKSAAFGKSAHSAVDSLDAKVAAAAAQLKAAHATASAAGAAAAEAAKRGADDAARRLVEAADGAAAFAAESRAAAASDAKDAHARREALARAVSLAAQAATNAVTMGSAEMTAGVDAVTAAVKAGDEALASWAESARASVDEAKTQVAKLVAAHTLVAQQGAAAADDAAATASAALASQRAKLGEISAALSSHEKDLEAHSAAVDAERAAAADAARGVGAGLDAAKSALERAVVQHREGQSALVADVVAQLRKTLETQTKALLESLEGSLGSGVCAAMAETGAIVETEARRAETSHASLVEATGAMRLAALAANQAVSAADGFADAADSGVAQTRTALGSMGASVAEAAERVGASAIGAFDATCASIDAHVASRESIASTIDSAAAGSKSATEAAATAVGEKMAAVSAAIATWNAAENAAVDSAEARATEASAKANASLRDATDAAKVAVESSAAEVRGFSGEVDAAMADASAAAAKHARDAKEAMGALGGEVASHVADVDLAHVPVEPVRDVEAAAFSRVLSSTPADEAVLSGGVSPAASSPAVTSVQDDEEEAFEDAEGDVVDVFGEVGGAPVVVESAPVPTAPTAPAADTENVVPAAAPAKKSLASMREGFKSKIAAPAGAERRTFGALKDVNAR